MPKDKLVITFRTRLRPGIDNELTELGTEMYRLATEMPGFLSYKEYAATDGENTTIVEFDTAENLDAWRNHPKHVAAQEVGRLRYFAWYQIQVCQVIREYSFEGHIDEVCAINRASDGLRRVVNRLQGKSNYDRTDKPDGSSLLIPKRSDGALERLTMTLLTDPEHSDVKAFNDLINATFDPSECDSLEGTQEFVRSNTDPRQFEAGKYIGILITNERNEPIGLINGDYIPTKGSDGQRNGEGVLAIGYVIVNEMYRGKGLSRDLYRRALELADQAAKEREQLLIGMIGESVPMLECRVNQTLEMMARSRIYTRDSNGGMVECQYIQPPLEPGGDTAPEHLMYGVFDEQCVRDSRVPLDVILQGVRALYERFAGWNEVAPEGIESHTWADHQRQLSDLFATFEAHLRKHSSDGFCYLISREDRKRRIHCGELFQEHSSADHLSARILDLVSARKNRQLFEYEELLRILFVDVDPNPADFRDVLLSCPADIREEIQARIKNQHVMS